MAWSDGFSTFNPGSIYNSPSLDFSKQFSGSSSKPSGGGNMWGAIASLGSSALSGIFTGQQEAANRQFAAQMGKMQAEMAMQGAMRQGQQNQWMVAAAPEYEFQRQKTAREYGNLFLEPQERYLKSAERRQQYRDETSPEARELNARTRQGLLARSAIDRRAVTDAMFGAPVFNASRYSNPAWMQA